MLYTNVCTYSKSFVKLPCHDQVRLRRTLLSCNPVERKNNVNKFLTITTMRQKKVVVCEKTNIILMKTGF